MVASERSSRTFRKMATGTCGRKDRNRLGKMDTALKNLRESISFLTPQSLSREASTRKLWSWTGKEGSRFGSIRNCSCFFYLRDNSSLEMRVEAITVEACTTGHKGWRDTTEAPLRNH